jgi:hypothetical protein
MKEIGRRNEEKSGGEDEGRRGEGWCGVVMW